MNGRLKIKSKEKLFGSIIEIDGKEFPVTDITITGNVNESVWKVNASFWAKGLDLDIIAKIELEKKES